MANETRAFRAIVVSLPSPNRLPRSASLTELERVRDYPGAGLETRSVCRLARLCVGAVLNCDPLLLVGGERGTRKLAFARQVAMHLVHIVAGRRHEDVALNFDRNRSTASHHFEVLENLRDVPEFDAFLCSMEYRFAAFLHYVEADPIAQWSIALKAMARAVERADLESDAHFDAKFVIDTFVARVK